MESSTVPILDWTVSSHMPIGQESINLKHEQQNTSPTRCPSSTKRAILLASSKIPGNHSYSNLGFKGGQASSRLDHLPQPGGESPIPHIYNIISGFGSTLSTIPPVESFISTEGIDLLLSSLKEMFQQDKRYALKTIRTQKLSGILVKGEANLEIRENLLTFGDLIVTDGALVQWSIASKESSMELQQYLGECSLTEAKAIGTRLMPHLENLLVHCFGNYILQRLIFKDVITRGKIDTCCRKHFVFLSQERKLQQSHAKPN